MGRRRHHRSFGSLRRRLFLWFGASILISTAVVSAIMGALWVATSGARWRPPEEQIRALTSEWLEGVWDQPEERDRLAALVSRHFALDLVLRDAQGQVLTSAGAPCTDPDRTLVIRRDRAALGRIDVCGLTRYRPRGPGWRGFVGLGLAVLALWAASGKIARRISRPMDELAHAARALGEGRLGTRASLRGRVSDEALVLEESFNEMAARIERQLAEQRELLAAVSHELRTPLGHMRLLIELARESGPDEKTLRELEQEVLEVDALVGQLLASSRLEFAQVNRAPLEANELARRALERAGLEPSRLQSSAPDLRFEGDPTLLQRALANLLDNAKKHGKGVKQLQVRGGDGRVVFEVDDLGDGFSPGEEAHAFDAFKRQPGGAPRATGHDAGSLHLGLSLVKRIAEAHGGRAFAGNLPEGGARVGFEVKV
jgi:signal transduction histidine kinase